MTGENKNKLVRLTVAQAIVKYLSVQYSERDGQEQRLIPAMFGIFGHGNVAGLGQALYEYGRDLPYYQPCNEQSMVHTASGFARMNLRKSTFACASSVGPGSTNMITGAALATINRLPVLLLPADYYATRRQGVVLQQLEHPISADVSVNDCFRPVSRYFDRISRPEQLLPSLPDAMRVLTDPAETGAVTISLPQDVQAHAGDFPESFFEKRVWRIERRQPSPERIAEAVALLKKAKRPVIVAGGGVQYSEAWDELQFFSERFGVPVGETCAGKGSIRGKSDWALGGFGVTGGRAAAQIVAQADLVICVGTRLTDFSTGSQSAFQNPDVRFISINVSTHDAFKEGALPITADAREALRELSEAAAAAGVKPVRGYLDGILRAKGEWTKLLNDELFQVRRGVPLNQGQVIKILNEESKADDLVLTAAGSPPADLHKLWDVTHGGSCYIEFGFSCMGFEVPAGLGARMARPKGEVYVFVGDGTYLMNPTELVTSVQEGLKITVIVSENHGYQCIRNLQMNRSGHSFGNEFRERDPKTHRLEGEFLKIDFAKNAESMGARVWKTQGEEQFRKALGEARKEKRTCVIVAETQPYVFPPDSSVWWDVAVAEVSDDPVTQKLRAQYERSRIALQRFHY
ncbi:MAG: 3D-(3,5/4)-trihydroxycyclohexane-1,2-dione acylhydrolase (decyclizing) [Candidatus Acidiferrales bacterium]